MGAHQSEKTLTDEWLTPPNILKNLGEFDLDPCSPIDSPWKTATNHFTINDDGLKQDWTGRVWCNPPYGQETGIWLNKLAKHGNGIALIFARTETKMFFEHVWNKADALLFIKGRIYFHRITGERAKANSGAPSVLVAYGKNNYMALINCKIPGYFVPLNYYI